MKSLWQKTEFDIEVAPNFFCVTFMDYTTKEKLTYEISSRKDERKAIVNFMMKYFERAPYGYQKSYLIGFNSEHYDIPMMNYLMFRKTPPSLQELDDFSKHIITTDFWWKDKKLTKFKYPSRRYISIDLYLYWSRMLRISKRISLKSLGIQLGYHTVQELPYEPNTPIPVSKFDEVIYYNRVHDLNITDLVMTALYKDIKLRSKIVRDYGLKCMSWDAPKIGINLLRKFYHEDTGKSLDISEDFNFIDISELILPDIEFTDKVTPIVRTKKSKNNYYTSNSSLLKELQGKTVVGTTELKARVVLEQCNGMKLVSDFGSGGIHGVAFKGILEPKEDEVLLDLDYSSYYPSLIQMLGGLGSALPIYTKIKDERIAAKKAGNKIVADTYKLTLNSVYGLMGNEYSGIKNLKDVLSVTVNGQLILQMLTSELMKMGISVVYQNTK